MRRMKRSHLKRFSAGYINTGQNPLPRRDRNTTTTDNWYERRLRNESGKVYYIRKLFKLEEDIYNDQHPRFKVLDNLLNMLGQQDPEKHVCLFSKKYTKLFLFWNSEYTQFYFTKQVCELFLKSIAYSSRDAALKAYRNDRITWIEHSGGSPSPDAA